MPEPAAVPESTDGIAPTRIDWKFIEGMAEGELCDHEDERSVCNICKMTLMARALLEARTPAASPVAGVSAESFAEWWNRVGRLFMAGNDIHVQRAVMGVAERTWEAAKLAQHSAEGDDASGIVPYLVGQIAALGPNPAGSRTNELFALLHEAIDSLRAEGDGWIAGSGVSLIAAERKRQAEVEGWTPEHDDEHNGNQIAMAAACYASPVPLRANIEVPCGCRTAECQHSAFGKHMWVDAWPWDSAWDKRRKHDRLRQLAIAGALIAAEIDRLKRLPAAVAKEERES